MNDVAMDIRSLRLAVRVAQKDLATRASVNTADLRRWERGFELPSEEELSKLSRALGVDTTALRHAQTQFMNVTTRGEGYTTSRPAEEGLTPRLKAIPARRLRVLDLFCGSGGFSYGFEM